MIHTIIRHICCQFTMAKAFVRFKKWLCIQKENFPNMHRWAHYLVSFVFCVDTGGNFWHANQDNAFKDKEDSNNYNTFRDRFWKTNSQKKKKIQIKKINARPESHTNHSYNRLRLLFPKSLHFQPRSITPPPNIQIILSLLISVHAG